MAISWATEDGKTGIAEDDYEFAMQHSEQPKSVADSPEPFQWQHVPGNAILDKKSLEESIDENGPALIVPGANDKHPKVQEFLKNPPPDFEIKNNNDLIYIRRKPGAAVASAIGSDAVASREILPEQPKVVGEEGVDLTWDKFSDYVHDLRVKFTGEPEKWSTKETVGQFLNQAMSVLGGGFKGPRTGPLRITEIENPGKPLFGTKTKPPVAENLNIKSGQIDQPGLDEFLDKAWSDLKKQNTPGTYEYELANQIAAKNRFKVVPKEENLTTETQPQLQQAQHKWSPAALTQAKEIMAKGGNYTDVANELGITPSYAGQRLKEEGIISTKSAAVTTLSDMDRFRELASKGLTIKEMARELKVTEGAISKRANEQGVEITPAKILGSADYPHVQQAFKDAVDKGFTMRKDIAREIGFSEEITSRIADKLNYKFSGSKSPDWTPETEARVLKLRNYGLSFSEIAESMGLTRGQVAGKLNRLKVYDVDALDPEVRDETIKFIESMNRLSSKINSKAFDAWLASGPFSKNIEDRRDPDKEELSNLFKDVIKQWDKEKPTK